MRRLGMLLLAIIISVASYGSAYAGRVYIQDDARLLTSADRDALDAKARDWSFDYRVLTSINSLNKQDFENRVSTNVQTPSTVSVGIDPKHRITTVRFGQETGISQSSWKSISSAGNPNFKMGQWGQGLIAVADLAQSNSDKTTFTPPPARQDPPRERVTEREVTTSTVTQMGQSGRSVHYTSPWWTFLLILLVVTVIILIIRALFRSDSSTVIYTPPTPAAPSVRVVEQSAPSYMPPVQRTYAAPTQSYSAPAAPVYSPPMVVQQPASPVIVHDRGSSGVGSLVTGMALGHMMSDHHDGGDHHHHDSGGVDRIERTDTVRERTIEREAPASSGGASSSWGSDPTPLPQAQQSSGASSSWDEPSRPEPTTSSWEAPSDPAPSSSWSSSSDSGSSSSWSSSSDSGSSSSYDSGSSSSDSSSSSGSDSSW